jgi:hypothetical protein
MKPTITKKQLLAILNLLSDLKRFESRNLGAILNLNTMYNFGFANTIFVRYEKDYMSEGKRVYDYNIAQVDEDGTTKFIDGNFSTPFERYSFLGECKVFDINDDTQYELKD